MRNLNELLETAYNTAYTLRANALAFRDIAFGNVVYAGNVIRHCAIGG